MPLGILSLLPMILTLAALPLVMRAFPAGAERRRAGGLLLGLFLVFGGLYLLWWSVTACWVVVGLGAATLAATAWPWRRRQLVGLVAAAALALGVAFELTGGDVGMLVYVAGAAPLLLGAAVALPLAAWLRWDHSLRAVLAALAVASAFTLIPFTSFYPTFLLTFEPAHVPVLAFALVGLAMLARWQAPRVEASRPLSAGAWIARPLPEAPAWLALGAAALAVAAAATEGALGAGVAVAAAAGLALRARIVGAQLLLLAAAVAAARAAADVTLTEGPLAVARLAAASIAATLAAVALALALARERELEARAAATRREAHLGDAAAPPAGALVREGAGATPASLDALARDAAAAGETRAVLVVRAPPDDPLWTLDDAAYAWLSEQRGPVRVHVAVREGSELSFVPPLLEAEVDA